MDECTNTCRGLTTRDNADSKAEKPCSWKSAFCSDTICRSSISERIVDIETKESLARCEPVQAGAGVSAGFDARTARLFSL